MTPSETGVIRMVVGLGNPGPAYAANRHNIGFMLLDVLAAEHGLRLDRQRFDLAWGFGAIGGRGVLVAKPMAYMNRSGPPVEGLARGYGIRIEQILVVHDDMDLAFGRIKIKEKGGHGGHKGIRSLMETLGAGGFRRLRLGIGRPEPGTGAIQHVLGDFKAHEVHALQPFLGQAGAAVATVLGTGTRTAMNRFNRSEP